MTHEELVRQIELKLQEIVKLKAAAKAHSNLSAEKRLALELFSKFGGHERQSDCGWYYEVKDNIDDWNGPDHQRWLAKARDLLAFCRKDNIFTEYYQSNPR